MADQFDVAIIGGGTAAMSAAITAGRLGLRTIILTGGVPGGQLVSIDKIDGVAGFPEGVPGYDFCPMSQEQADAAGATLSMTECTALAAEGDQWRLTSEEGELLARGVVLATGTALARLGVEGEERLAGKGVSDCASCDAPLLRNKVAVVVGGGDSAMQEALTLAEHLSKVIILEQGADLSGQIAYRDRVRENAKIEIRTGTSVSAILGTDAVSGVRLKDVGSGAESALDTNAVFVFIGLVPNSDLARGLVPLDSSGRVVVDAGMRTGLPGLCAAGNVRSASAHRAAAAMGDGATAAFSLADFFATGTWAATA